MRTNKSKTEIPGQIASERKAVVQTSFDSQDWSATIISSPGRIAELATFIHNVAPDQAMLDPRFFLASILPEWRPCVVVVSQGQRMTGLLYCRERLVAGIGTRIIVGDDSLGIMVVARSEEAESVIDCAVKTLIKRMATLRLMVDPGKLPLLRGLEAMADVRLSRAERHAHLELPPSYDSFLTKVGPHTRRNLRYYRRKSELANNEFSPGETYPNFCAATRRLFPRAEFTGRRTNLERCLAMIEAMPSRIMVGLRDRNGDLISVAGGWHDGHRAVVIMQLNDRAFPRASLSLVLRSYLIEDLIRRDFRELIFWAGSSAPISSYSGSPELWIAHINPRTTLCRIHRQAIAIASKLAPRASQEWFKWVVGDGLSPNE
jgi:Acetyltransferase (GNAT) domain